MCIRDRAERREQENLELYQNYAVQYPQNREYWEKQAERCAAKIGTYIMMTFDEFQAAQRAYYLGMPLHEITCLLYTSDTFFIRAGQTEKPKLEVMDFDQP